MNTTPLTTELVPAPDKNSRRLMIVLHGLGDSMEGFRWLPSALGLPWLNYLLVNAPDPYFGGWAWYDFAGDPRPGITRSRKLLFTLLDQLGDRGFTPADTILFGFSQGCLMMLEVGLRYPHRFAGLIGVSGYAHEPERLLAERPPVAGRQRILLTHGTRDPLIPLAAVREQVELLKAGGVDITWREFIKAHTIAGEEEVAVIRAFITAGWRATGNHGIDSRD